MPVQCTCAECGAPFIPAARYVRVGKGLFCSRGCAARNRWQANRIACICAQCQKAFTVRASYIPKGGGRYCSRACQGIAQLRGEERTCRGCGMAFYVSAANLKRGQGLHCTPACAQQQRDYRELRSHRAPTPRTGEHRTCRICSTVFYAKPYTIRDGHGLYCSDACRGVSRRSEMQDRSGWQYKAWRNAVFTRDNWTCQRCGKRGADLHAHHIELWSRRPDLRFDVSNGLTLHETCHRALHIEQKTGFFS